MRPIRAIVHDRRIELSAPDDLPDGTHVLVDITRLSNERIGIAESEWRDDSQALSDWAAWLETIEPVAFAIEDPFSEEFRRINVDAVRKQMAEGPDA